MNLSSLGFATNYDELARLFYFCGLFCCLLAVIWTAISVICTKKIKFWHKIVPILGISLFGLIMFVNTSINMKHRDADVTKLANAVYEGMNKQYTLPKVDTEDQLLDVYIAYFDKKDVETDIVLYDTKKELNITATLEYKEGILRIKHKNDYIL